MKPASGRENPKRCFFRFNTSEVNVAKRELTAIFPPLMTQTRAHAALVYRADSGVDSEMEEFRAVAARSVTPARIPELGVTIGEAATSVLKRSTEPFQTSRVDDERFANLPEFLQFGITSLLILPLRTADSILGFLTLGRTSVEPFEPQAVQSALPLAHLTTAVLERDALHIALRERKLVERAKGLIQRRRRLSEEDAYHFIRNQSRRARRPMIEVAEDIISAAALRKTA
jgi:transcriptional regulator with GAF, ATPase, and Fis domain